MVQSACMSDAARQQLLTVNGGSSSIKFALFEAGEPPRRILSGLVERIGLADAQLHVQESAGEGSCDRSIEAPDHAHAVGHLIDWLEERIGLGAVAAIGHRIVHGGARYIAPSRIDDELVAELRRLSPIDPAHLPGEIAVIDAFRARCPKLPGIACFDTAFHRDLPQVARLLPVPRRYASMGVRRYGFHGLSYAYLLEELARTAGEEAARGRVILAHLGAGCSLAAVKAGRCVDTTMGFTPTAGLVMGRRSGDLDPGFLIHLLRTERLSGDQLDELVNKQSGLLGLSETSPDIRDLLACENNDIRAAEAVAVFCYQARKWVGAYAAALGGLDTLVFSAGIGENSASIRCRICSGLEFLGVRLDSDRNESHAPIISADDARVTVRIMRTDEESMIAREVIRLLDTDNRRPQERTRPK
jgi:acetate kinase